MNQSHPAPPHYPGDGTKEEAFPPPNASSSVQQQHHHHHHHHRIAERTNRNRNRNRNIQRDRQRTRIHQHLLACFFNILLWWVFGSTYWMTRQLVWSYVPATITTATSTVSSTTTTTTTTTTSMEDWEEDGDQFVIEDRRGTSSQRRRTSNQNQNQNHGAEKPSVPHPRRYFANPHRLSKLVALGSHFLTTQSGCRMARWYYPTRHLQPRYRDCSYSSTVSTTTTTTTGNTTTGNTTGNHKRSNSDDDKRLRHAHQLQAMDTIYVTWLQLEEFVATILPELSVDVVVLTGQIQKVPPLLLVSNTTLATLLEHPHVVAWFGQNLSVYAAAFLYHPKVAPFPYGLKEVVMAHRQRPSASVLPNPSLQAFRQVFAETFQEPPPTSNAVVDSNSNSNSNSNSKTNHEDQNNQKPQTIYAGYLHPWPHRVEVTLAAAVAANPPHHTQQQQQQQQQQQRLPILEYLRGLAHSRYVISPNGDRPECYRHYEALGLGTIPITQLPERAYRHLSEGPVVYDNRQWNVTWLLQHKIPDQDPVVNRNLIFEEYWMEWIEWTTTVAAALLVPPPPPISHRHRHRRRHTTNERSITTTTTTTTTTVLTWWDTNRHQPSTLIDMMLSL